MENVKVKAVKKLGGGRAFNPELVESVFNEAENASEVVPGRRVYIALSKTDKLYGLVYTNKAMDNASAVAQLKAADNKGEEEEFNTLEEALPVVEGGYEAVIIGKVNPTTLALRISPAKAAGEAPLSEKSVNDIKEETKLRIGLTDGEFNERLELLKTYGITPKNGKLFKGVLALMGRQPEGKEIAKPKVLYAQDKQNIIKKMFMHLVSHENLLLEGNKSVGKNVAWETVSYLLNRKLFMLQCDENMTFSSIFGHLSTDNSGKTEITVEKVEKALKTGEGKAELIATALKNMSPTLTLSPGPVTSGLLHENAGYGAIILLDEMNLTDPATFTGAFNTLTDRHAKFIHINDLGDVEIPDSLIMGGTQNGAGGDYLGTKEQNPAAMSRWSCIKVKDSGSIRSLLESAPGAEDVEGETLDTLDAVYREFVAMAENGTVSDACLNLRGFKAAVGAISYGLSVLEAVTDCVINTVGDADMEQSLKETVKICIR